MFEDVLILKKGGIHIKKKNRGKFTEYCGGKVTEECIAKGKKSKDPKIRKRATFASNSRRWKHENGGIIRFQPGGTVKLDNYGYPADITPAVVTQDSKFNKFLMTLPDNLRLTPEKDYHMYAYWKLSGKPENFKEGERRGMFTWDNSDKGYHAGSIAEDRNTGIYHFMKPKHHPTVKYELDWFNKGLQTLEGGKQVPVKGRDKKFWEDFKSKYQLDTTGVDYRYVPIKKNGGILKAQEGAGNNFWSKLWNAIKEGGMAARDAKIGAVGAQQVRDLYSEGKNQEAQDLAKQYAKANTTGIALAGGTASTGLLGDLMVTGATTTADTFIDGDVDNFGKNLVKNAAGDLIGHGTSKLLTHLRTNELNKYIDYLNESRRQELFPKSEDVYYHIDTDARPLFNTNAKLHPSKDVSRVLPGLAREEGDTPYIWFNRRSTYGTPKHDRIVFGSKEDLHLKSIQETNLPHNEVEGFYVTEGYPNTDKIQMYRGYPISIGGTKPIYVFGKEIFYAPK